MFNQYKGLRKELYILFIGKVMTNMGSMIWPMITLILNKKLGMNASLVANWLLVFTFVSLPVALIGGKLTDKLNKRNIIIVCDIVSIVCFVICSFIELTFTSIILVAIAGMFQTIEHPAYDALVADFSLPKDRARAYSLSYLGGNLGLVLSPTISGILFNDYLNIAFLISGISILISTILIFLKIKNVKREESYEDINEYENDLDTNTNVFKYFFSNKVLFVYLIFFVLYSSVYNQFNYLMPLEMVSVYNDYGSVLYGTLTSVNCITVVLCTSFITKFLSKYFDTTKVILGAFFCVGGLFIFRTFVSIPLLTYFAMIVFTIGEIIESIGSRPFQSKRIAANYRGRVMSLIYVFENVIISFMRLLVGNIYDSRGSLSAWMLVYIIGAIAIGICVYLRRIDRQKYPNLYE